MNHVLIYVDKTTNRLQYIFDFIIGNLLGLQSEFTSDKEKFNQHSGAKFSYCSEPLADEIFFQSSVLLFETNLRPQPINFCEHGRLQGFYPVYHSQTVLPFDIFSSAFFMLTRYEEYLTNKKDKYDRYRGSQSMNYKAGFLEKPMINYYAIELKKILLVKFPSLVFARHKFSYTATFDIDMAYSYLHKGFKRNFGGFVRSIMLSKMDEVRERFAVLTKARRDPFDTYDYIFQICEKYNIPTVFFFLLGDQSRFDKNIPYDNPEFQSLIRSIHQKTKTGIHLSFKSHIGNKQTEMEINRLQEITTSPALLNRFHYLRFNIPSSFARLVKMGIKEDFSMGYPGRIGFRTGTCHPHYFFNVKTNEITDLKIVPFAFMDTTFTHYLRINPEQSIEKIRALMARIKEVEGPMVGLWHNSSLTNRDEWKGWKKNFEEIAQEASELTAS